MYNEEIKKMYIEETSYINPSFKIYGERLFKQISNKEQELNKDCCEFTIKEIITYYRSKMSSSLETLNVINYALKAYTNWCLSKNMINDNQNHYNEVTAELLNSCLNYGIVMDKIISRADLLHLIEDFNNVSDKALFLAIFEGISGEEMCELVNLNCNDLDGNEVTLCTGRKLELSNTLINYMRESQETYEYYVVRGDDVMILRKLYPGDTGVFKAVDSGKLIGGINRKVLYNKLSKFKKILGLNYLTNNTLIESGRIEMLRKAALDNPDLPISRLIRDTEYRYGKVASIKMWVEKYGKYIEG